MNATYASHILEEMSYDNAVDILNELTKPKVASLLTLMNKDDQNEIKALLHYDTRIPRWYYDDGVFIT